MAARGTRNLTGKEEQMDDAEALAQVRRQALKVHLQSVAAAAALTALFLLLPAF